MRVNLGITTIPYPLRVPGGKSDMTLAYWLFVWVPMHTRDHHTSNHRILDQTIIIPKPNKKKQDDAYKINQSWRKWYKIKMITICNSKSMPSGFNIYKLPSKHHGITKNISKVQNDTSSIGRGAKTIGWLNFKTI